jgi:GNAT superfamily N-acetyltransferase
MRIRKALEADRSRTIALGKQMHAEGAYAFLPFEEERAMVLFDAHTGDPEMSCLWVGEQDQELTGLWPDGSTSTSSAPNTWPTTPLFYVPPQHRGSGVAQALIAAFRGWARRRGAIELSLSISTGVHAQRIGRFL